MSYLLYHVMQDLLEHRSQRFSLCGLNPISLTHEDAYVFPRRTQEYSFWEVLLRAFYRPCFPFSLNSLKSLPFNVITFLFPGKTFSWSRDNSDKKTILYSCIAMEEKAWKVEHIILKYFTCCTVGFITRLYI